MIVLELIEHDTPIETAAGGRTLERLKSLVPVLERIDADNVGDVVGLASSCHAGYSVTDSPYRTTASTADTSRLESSLVARAVAGSAATQGRPRAADARGLLVSKMRAVGDPTAHGRDRDQRAAAVRAAGSTPKFIRTNGISGRSSTGCSRSARRSCSSARWRCSSFAGSAGRSIS